MGNSLVRRVFETQNNDLIALQTQVKDLEERAGVVERRLEVFRKDLSALRFEVFEHHRPPPEN